MSRKLLLVITITLMLLVTIAIPAIAEDDKKEEKAPTKEIAKTATITTDPVGKEKVVKLPQLAWVRKGPISLSAYTCKDWSVYYGGYMSGKPVAVVSLSIPWTSNSKPHSYSINTENNYMSSSRAWVQVKSLDSTGVPYPSYINLIAIY